MTRPNFFLIGAPKCGTTALSEYLRQHSRIGFSVPKEPHFFCTDFPEARNFTEERDYLDRCFGHCRGLDLLAVGEGSTNYFFSTEAIPNILRFEPKAKFIVMLRNPVEMIHALHAQKLLSLEEDVTSFEKAWVLQEQRLRGRHLPRHCRDPKLIHYANLGKLGLHLQRIFSQVPETQRRVILFEDFVRDTRKVYAEVLHFLEIPDEGRTDFPKVNEKSETKIQALYQFSHRPPASLMQYVSFAKRFLGIERLGILSRILAWNLTAGKRRPLTENMRKTLLAEFAPDVDLLSDLLGQDLSHWKA